MRYLARGGNVYSCTAPFSAASGNLPEIELVKAFTLALSERSHAGRVLERSYFGRWSAGVLENPEVVPNLVTMAP